MNAAVIRNNFDKLDHKCHNRKRKNDIAKVNVE